mgnify:CR=1 FL=1
MLAAVVLVAKGLIDLAAGVRASRVPTSLRRLTARLSSVSLLQFATLAQAVLTLPALAATPSTFGAFVIVVYDLFFVQQAHAVKARTRTACKRSLLIASAAKQLKRADRTSPRSALCICPDKTCQNKPVPFW